MCAYVSNVRSILEYGSVIWAGAAETHTVRIDRVQHKFLIWLLSYTTSGHSRSLEYSDLLNHFQIPSLASRRVQHDLLFVRNVVISRIDSDILLRNFSLHAPTRSIRTQRLFYVPRPRVNTVKRGLFIRVPNLVNSFLGSVPEADFFADDFSTYKTRVVTYVVDAGVNNSRTGVLLLVYTCRLWMVLHCNKLCSFTLYRIFKMHIILL